MRSIYLISNIDILNQIRLRGLSKYSTKLKSGKNLGKLKEVQFPKDTGTDPIKFEARNWARALAPNVSLLEIDRTAFIGFLNGEKPKLNSLLIRFWEIKPKKIETKAILAGREQTDICTPIETALTRLGRGTNWAGVTFTHPDLRIRAQLYRYPTASICPERIDSRDKRYQELKNRFERFLKTQIP